MTKKKTQKEPIYKTCRNIGKQLDDAIYVCGFPTGHECKHALYNFSEDGSFGVNQNVLIEIGAAFVLYNRKVILLADRRVSIPSNLQGLYQCRYEGDQLDGETTMKLLEALTGFREENS